MSEAVDVGSVLGGRYKVTAYVLASADKDLVLEGMDQVLNRPVSILVASEGNASQVIATARELASGERDEYIQVLDLSISDTRTYLVTNRAPAADMLDLIVQREVNPEVIDAPYVEPFFTESLGSEIFGRTRSEEPEDGYEDYEDAYDDEPEDEGQRRPSRLAGFARRFGRREPERSDDDADQVPDDAEQDDTYHSRPAATPVFTPRPGTHSVPPPPDRRPGGSSPASASAAVSSTSQAADRSQQDRAAEQNQDRSAGAGGTAMAAGAAGAAGVAAQQTELSASSSPLSGHRDHDPDDIEEYEDTDGGGRRFTRLLVGAVLAVGIIVAVVFAATTLGSLNTGTTPVADPQGQVTEAPAEPAEPETTAPAAPSPTPSPEPVPPVITAITRVVPDNQALDVGNDGTLPLIIDGDPTTFWGNQVYASETFGGLASNLALVLELEQESTVSEVSITQISGSGGTFSVLLNSEPTLQGAEEVAQGSFIAPTVTVPIPEGADGPPTAQYVIVNFTQLPRLAIQAQFPFGLRIAEIEVD